MLTNKRVILENAAIPPNQKRTILTQECLRRLRNTKHELGEQVRAMSDELMRKLLVMTRLA